MKRVYTVCLLLALLCLSLSASAEAVMEYKISGVPENIQKNILSRLQSDQLLYPQPLTETSINALYKNAPSSISAAIEPFGYFKAKITPQGLNKQSKDKWVAKFKITLNTPLKITKLEIRVAGPGASQKDFKKLLEDFPLKQGQILEMGKYNKAKDSLTDLASSKGFLSAKFTQKVIYIDLEKYRSEIIIHFDTGPQFYFGNVTFKDPTYDPAFLQRFVQFNPGENYSSDTLLQLQQDLNSTVYFKSVSIHPDEGSISHHQVPIDVYLDPQKAKSYDFGVGYGTDTGIRGTMDMVWRHITDTGHYFRGFIQASEVQSSAFARYIIPGNNPITDQYFFSGNLETQNINNSNGNTQKLGMGMVDQASGWQRTMAINYQWDQYSINKDPRERTHLFLPSLLLSKSRADNIVFPRKGYRVNLNLQGAAKPIISSSSFIQGEIDGKYIFSPSEQSRVILRGDVGVTAANSLALVPLSLQFFAGGSNSIRGYRYQQLGPGRYLLVGSAEIQFQVKGKWWGAFFIDAGNAINSFTDPAGTVIGTPPGGINLDQVIKFSPGLGVVYISPVGPVQLTLAKSISDPKQPPRIQFTMGSSL